MEKVDEVLRNAGYIEGRMYEVDEITDFYNNKGYKYTSKQIDFLKSYGGLVINYLHPHWKQEVSVALTPLEASKAIDSERINDYIDYIGENMVIIGEILKVDMILFMSDSGIIYGGFDDCLIKWGSDFRMILQMLIEGQKGELLFVD